MKKNLLFIGFITAMFFSSCSYYHPSIMFKAKKSYEYDALVDSLSKEYIIRKNDLLKFDIYSKDGYKLVDVTSNERLELSKNVNEVSLYLVESNGEVNLPVAGRVTLENLTVREAQEKLKKKYSEFYINPYVLLSVENKRVVVFTGEGKEAKVVVLKNENTTLIEILGLAGGISSQGKAKEIKIIRNVGQENVKVFNVDLSTIEGIQLAGTIIHPNDVIYVRPTFNLFRETITEIAPILSIFTATLSLIVTWRIFNNQ